MITKAFASFGILSIGFALGFVTGVVGAALILDPSAILPEATPEPKPEPKPMPAEDTLDLLKTLFPNVK